MSAEHADDRPSTPDPVARLRAAVQDLEEALAELHPSSAAAPVADQLLPVLSRLVDVTERHRLAGELADALEVFELGFSAAPIGHALVAADGRWLKVNAALAAITGRTEAELLACTFQDITHPADLDADLDLVRDVLAGVRGRYEMEKRYLRPDGSQVWVQLSVAGARRADGSFRFFVVQVQDIDQRKADQRALRYQAEHDSLTGLRNRRRLRAELQAVTGLGQRSSDRAVLLLLDLDRFKALNDAQGHDAGDAHLCEVAAVLQASVRAGDTCARLGGDEFAVLLRNADVPTAEHIARRIADQVAALARGTTVSIGLAAWREGDDEDTWLVRADRAMYRVKRGRPEVPRQPDECAPAPDEHAASQTLDAAARPGPGTRPTCGGGRTVGVA